MVLVRMFFRIKVSAPSSICDKVPYLRFRLHDLHTLQKVLKFYRSHLHTSFLARKSNEFEFLIDFLHEIQLSYIVHLILQVKSVAFFAFAEG